MSKMTLPQLQPAGRRLARPNRVERCQHCSAAQGENYALCSSCTEVVERYWRADWQALLTKEQVEADNPDEQLLASVIHAEIETQPWTLIDSAMTLLRCPACQAELGGGPIECEECKFAFGNLWWHDQLAAQQGVMTMNEHSLRVGRWVLRFRHRHSPTIATSWSLSMPFLLTGWMPTTAEAQRGKALINQGRVDEVRACLARRMQQINRRKNE